VPRPGSLGATQGTINRLVAADPIKIIAHKKDVFQKV